MNYVITKSPVLEFAACVWLETELGFRLVITFNGFCDFEMNTVEALQSFKGATIFEGTLAEYEDGKREAA